MPSKMTNYIVCKSVIIVGGDVVVVVVVIIVIVSAPAAVLPPAGLAINGPCPPVITTWSKPSLCFEVEFELCVCDYRAPMDHQEPGTWHGPGSSCRSNPHGDIGETDQLKRLDHDEKPSGRS